MLVVSVFIISTLQEIDGLGKQPAVVILSMLTLSEDISGVTTLSTRRVATGDNFAVSRQVFQVSFFWTRFNETIHLIQEALRKMRLETDLTEYNVYV